MKPAYKRSIFYILKLLVSGAAFYYVFHNVPFQELGRVFSKTRLLPVILALGLYLASQAVSTIRLHGLLKARNIDVPFRMNFKLYLVGMSYNLFLPGGVGGDGYKIWWISRKYLRSKRKVFTSVLLDRLSGLLAIVLLLLMVVPVRYTPGGLLFVPLVLMPVLFAAVWVFIKKVLPKYNSVYLGSMVWSVLIQILQILCILSLAYAVRAEVDFSHLMFIFLVSSIATAVPVFLGGIGARELVFGLLATQLGMNTDFAVSIALLFSIITVILSLPGLAIDWKLKLP